MFDDLLKFIDGLDGSIVSVSDPAEADEDGYIDRQCPSDNCRYGFKVLLVDWQNEVSEEAVWCPNCRHEALAEDWLTDEQIEIAKNMVVAKVEADFGKAMKRDALAFNRKQSRSSLVSISMNYKGSPTKIVLPSPATEIMQLKITCDECSCRFAVIGAAYFCPSCGHNSADKQYKQSLNNICKVLDGLTEITLPIEDRDLAENARRFLIEDSLQRVVSAFQRNTEALLHNHLDDPKVRKNVFQNLEQGSESWATFFGNTYDSHLSKQELEDLNRFFQMRHILTHREGLVDEGYIKKSGDLTYLAGQRLVVQASDVRECLSLAEKLSAGLSNDTLKFTS